MFPISNVAIFLRTQACRNYFRDLILKLIDSKIGNDIILCSGFFQEQHGKSLYKISTEGDLATRLHRSNVSISVLGIYNNMWLQSYIYFVSSLRGAGVKVNAYKTSNLRWHAKLFIFKRNNSPLLAIIGSSNMTRPAFGLSHTLFNYECDVVLWDSNHVALNKFITNFFQESEGKQDIVLSEYDSSFSGLSIPDILKRLENELNIEQYEILP